MPRYRACASVAGSKYLGEFEAATKEEAEAMAWDEADVSLCHQCSDECSDAEVQNIFLEEIEPEPKTRARKPKGKESK